MQQISRILIDSEKVGRALRAMYEYRKKQNAGHSLQFISRRAGIPSRAHLTDVMSFRRTLKMDYARPICRVFGLDQRQTRIFVLMAKLEKSKDLIEKASLAKQLVSAKKLLNTVEAEFKSLNGNPLDFSRVFCSLGMIKGSATAAKISVALGMNLEEAGFYLKQLVERGYLIEEEGSYLMSNKDVHFSSGQYVEMLKAYIENSYRKVDQWVDSQDSFFESSTVSVPLSRYRELLPKIRETFLEYMSELESEDADGLVHFNIQVFPDKDK